MTENRDEAFQLDIMEMLRGLWSNILIIILVAVLGGGIAFGYTFMFVKPQYSATATLYVNKSSFSLGGSNFSISSGLSTDTLVDLYRVIIDSRTTLEEVADEAGLTDVPTDSLRKMIRTSGTDSGALNITVTSSNPSQAELVANTIAKLLPDRIANIIDGSSVRVIDYAIIPSSRSSPDYITSTAMGLLIGAVLSIGIILVKFYIAQLSDSAVHSVDELKNSYPDLPILASIPDMRVTGKNAYYSSYYGNYYGNNGNYYGNSERK